MQTKHQKIKDWLSRARNMQKRLDALQESKQKAYEMACSSTVSLRLDAAAQVKPAQPNNPAAQYVYFSEEVNKQIARLEQVRAEILNTIAQVEDNTLAALLVEYYVNNKTWYEVANILGYSFAHVTKTFHVNALREVAKILNNPNKS